MKASHFALVIPTHTPTRASFAFFEFGVYIVQLTHPQVERTKVSSVLHTQAMIHQERILFFVLFLKTKQNGDPWAKAENSRAMPTSGSGC